MLSTCNHGGVLAHSALLLSKLFSLICKGRA